MKDKKDSQPECEKEDCTSNPEDCKQDPASCMANSVYFNRTKSSDENVDDCMGRSLDQLSKAFMGSARRWEMIVYPSLFAFIILAAYGFFLIYSLTKDTHLVVQDMHRITMNMEQVVMNMDKISKNMVLMTQTVDSQSASMKEMVYHMRGMNISMNQMRYDMSVMNNSISRPMSFMNDFMPW